MSPWVGTVLLSLGYAALLFWAVRAEAGGAGGWRDLRWWIAILVVVQLA